MRSRAHVCVLVLALCAAVYAPLLCAASASEPAPATPTGHCVAGDTAAPAMRYVSPQAECCPACLDSRPTAKQRQELTWNSVALLSTAHAAGTTLPVSRLLPAYPPRAPEGACFLLHCSLLI